jgi:UDP-2-acetamido-2,6-beta-L-arabino-hexul-4-ose reductase
MNVLVTGADGFIGKNLIVRLNELGIIAKTYTRTNSSHDLTNLVKKTDFIIHLAGENRPTEVRDFNTVNIKLTALISEAVRKTGRHVPIILTSSIQAKLNNPYGVSKLGAEKILRELKNDTGNPVYIYRLTGVFGKWCKPNYNSVVATFCYNIINDRPIQVNDPLSELSLVYVDDVVNEFISVIQNNKIDLQELSIQPEYKINLGELADQIQHFHDSRYSLISEKVGTGLVRKLYSTYISYLPTEKFCYSIPSHIDSRGIFAEILKTKDSGQFSFFTARPGIVRGGHYHHSKTEKFLVVKGEAKFRFKHIITNEIYEVFTSNHELKIVETVPGWAHDITNIGSEEMIVILWANENFDQNNPDTINLKL